MRRRPLQLVLCLALLALPATGCKQPLTWGPPSMSGTVRTIDVPVGGGEWYGIPATTDCLVRMPNVRVQGRVKVDGCRNVRLVGGELHSDAAPCSAAANGTAESPAIYFNNWSGVAHIEGVKITGPGFSDGIWMTSTKPASVGQVEGTWIGRLAACQEPVSGYENGWPAEHPNCFQTWSGPNVLRIDKNTCHTIYEGFNVDTNSLADTAGVKHPARVIDIRRTNVRLDERVPNGRGCFVAYRWFLPAPTHTEDVSCTVGNSGYVPTFPRMSVDRTWWPGVAESHQARPDQIQPDEAGLGYTRPVALAAGRAPVLPGAEATSPGGAGLLPASRFKLRRALKHGLFSHVRCVRPCRAVARATLGRRDARRLGLGRRSTVVARGALRSRRAGRHRFTIRFTSRARAHLRRARRVELRVSVSIRERGAKRRTLARTITLARPS